MFFKIALRNIFRNKRRTILSLGIVALGVAMLSLALGFISSSLKSTEEQLSRESGALQIANQLLFDNKADEFEYLIDPETLEVVTGILDQDERVTGYSYEISFGGIIGNEKGSTVLISRGLIPNNPVEDYSSVMLEGEPLNDDGTPQIIIGKRMAEVLGVEVGDIINLATGTVTGAFKAASARIVGTFRYNNLQLEEQLGFVPLAFAQRVMRTDGVDKVLVRIENLDDAADVAADIQNQLTGNNITLETRIWKDLTTFYESIEQFWGVFSAFATIGVLVLAFFSILEVLTMSFLERTREVGTIRAVGTKRLQVFSTFLMEGILLGIMGGVLGIVLGFALAGVINVSGVGWQPPGSIENVPLSISISANAVITPFVAALIATILGTLYPAIKNARKNIVQALSYV